MKQYKALFSFIKPYLPKVLLNLLSNIMVALFTIFSIPLIIPFFSMIFGEEDTTQLVNLGDKSGFINQWYASVIDYFGASNAIIVVCGVLVLVYFLKNMFRYISMLQLTTLKNSIVRDLRQSIFSKILVLPLSYYSEEKKGNIIARFSTDVQEVDNSILSVLESFIKSPLILIGSIGYMLYVSPTLSGFVLLMLLFTVFIIGAISKTLKRNSGELQGRMGNLIATLEETLGAMKVIKGFHAEKYLNRHFNESNIAYKKLADKVGKRRDLSSPLTEVLSVIVIALIMWFGSTLVMADQLGAPEFFSFLLAFFYTLEPSKMLSTAYYNLQKGMAAADRITYFLEEDNGIVEPENPNLNFLLNEGIRFNNVSFRYPGTNEWVLRNVNLFIPKGKIVALVGTSGAGKSTISDLIPRFYDVTEGQILIDNEDIRNFPTPVLRSHIGIVNQDPILFNDTLANNILFGAENKHIKDIEEAAGYAYAHDFISQLPEGYETIVGDRGVKLSGGQRQRITIARAILKNPDIMILDEATSALDSESEKFVQQALKEVMKERTSLIIAHRLSTIQNADIIYVLERGAIIESGTHDELITAKGIYASFVESQNRP